MADTTATPAAGQRDRSPGYPLIPLGAALDRLAEFETHFKRSSARPEKIGDAWGLKAKARADRIGAALRYFGLLDYQTVGKDRHVVVSDEGRKYLRAQQEETKREVIKAAALRPKQIAKFWAEWGKNRPADAACLDDLVFKNSFSDAGARDFLKVYDATISFAGLSDSDKYTTVSEENAEDVEEQESNDPEPENDPQLERKAQKARIMEGERELTTGLLSKEASFRLIVTGTIGVKEIERLIKKLELDKEILSDQDETAPDEEAAN